LRNQRLHGGHIAYFREDTLEKGKEQLRLMGEAWEGCVRIEIGWEKVENRPDTY